MKIIIILCLLFGSPITMSFLPPRGVGLRIYSVWRNPVESMSRIVAVTNCQQTLCYALRVPLDQRYENLKAAMEMYDTWLAKSKGFTKRVISELKAMGHEELAREVEKKGLTEEIYEKYKSLNHVINEAKLKILSYDRRGFQILKIYLRGLKNGRSNV